MRYLILILYFLPLCLNAQNTDNNVCSYETDGKEKSSGLKLRIKHPCLWIVKDGDRPGIVKKFIGDSSQTIMLSIRKIPSNINSAEIKRMVKIAGMKEALEEQTIINLREIIIDKTPAGEAIFTHESERSVGKMYIKSLSYFLVYKFYYIKIEYTVGGLSNTKEMLNRIFDRFEFTFKSLVNQTMILSQYE